MKAAIFLEANEPLVVESVEPLDPGPGDVVVKIDATGVCHSDLSIVNGTVGIPGPIVLGHEGAGTVEWVGSEVSRVKPGDHVIASITPVCGTCWHCTRQETHLCEWRDLAAYTPRYTREDGAQFAALSDLGTFAEGMTCSQFSLVPIQTDVPSEQLALIGCGATTGMSAALNSAEVGPGDTIAVIGCGGVGIGVIQGAKVGGAARIIAVDPVAEKRQAALDLGATDAVDPNAGDAVEQVMAATGGRGVDYAFEVVGAQALMDQAMRMTRRGGTTVFVGVPPGDANVPLFGMQAIIGNKTVKGTWYGGAQALRDIPRYVALIEAGRIDLDTMVSKRLPLEGINDAFDAMRTGTGIRSVLVP